MNKKSKIINRKSFFILNSLFLILFSGCQPARQAPKPPAPAVHAVWESAPGQSHWKLTLLDDGTLSEVVNAAGLQMVLKDGGTRFDLGKDSFAQYIYGPCHWSYNSEEKILKAVVTIDDLFVKSQQAEVSYGIVDTFEGKVSEDGKVWNASWTTTERYKKQGTEKTTEGGIIKFKLANPAVSN